MQRKVDELGERLLQRGGRVEAGVVLSERIVRAEKCQWIGLEESGDAAEQGRPIGGRVGRARASSTEPRNSLRRMRRQNSSSRVKPILRLVAGDETRVDGADRGPDDPVRLDPGFMQRLVDAGLVGPERAAALKHQHDLAIAR